MFATAPINVPPADPPCATSLPPAAQPCFTRYSLTAMKYVEKNAAASCAHDRHRGMRHVKDGLHIDCIDVIELRLSHVQHRLVAVCRSGVVDDDVQTPKAVARHIHRTAHVGNNGDIAFNRQCGVSDLGTDASRTALIDVGDALANENLTWSTSGTPISASTSRRWK